MSRSIERNKKYLNELQEKALKQNEPLLTQNFENSQKMVKTPRTTDEFVQKRWKAMGYESPPTSLYNESDKELIESYGKNVEYGIGTVKIPVGIAGPLRINGLHAKGDFMIPLATIEAALVASYHRGACLITKAGGATSVLLGEVLVEAPVLHLRQSWKLEHLLLG